MVAKRAALPSLPARAPTLTQGRHEEGEREARASSLVLPLARPRATSNTAAVRHTHHSSCTSGHRLLLLILLVLVDARVLHLVGVLALRDDAEVVEHLLLAQVLLGLQSSRRRKRRQGDARMSARWRRVRASRRRQCSRSCVAPPPRGWRAPVVAHPTKRSAAQRSNGAHCPHACARACAYERRTCSRRRAPLTRYLR